MANRIEELPSRGSHDVLCCIKHHMRNKKVNQIITALGADAVVNLDDVPLKTTDRKIIPTEFQRKVRDAAKKLRLQGYITLVAESFLSNWVTGSLPKHPRPTSYPWLQYRWNSAVPIPRAPRSYDPPSVMSRMVVNQIPVAPIPSTNDHMADDDDADSQGGILANEDALAI